MGNLGRRISVIGEHEAHVEGHAGEEIMPRRRGRNYLGGGIGVIGKHEAHVAGHAGEGEMPEERTLHQPAGAAAY